MGVVANGKTCVDSTAWTYPSITCIDSSFYNLLLLLNFC